MRKQAIIITALLALSVITGGVSAVDVVQEDGTAITAEAASPLQLTEGDTGNITVQFTEDHQLADGSSQIIAYLNESAASVELASSTGSGTASLSLASNKTAVWANETGGGANSATVTAFNVTFNTTTSGSDGINVSEAMSSEADLGQDDDDTENVTYIVVDDYIETSYSVDGEAGGEINTTDGEYVPNQSGQAQFTFDLTRNDTTYENYSVDTLKYEVAMNTTYFSDIEEKTSEDVDEIVLEDVKSEDGQKVFVWAIQAPDNTTEEFWDDLEVVVNATVMSGEANGTITHTETHDPSTGGPEATHTTSYDHAAGGAVISSPQFFSIGDLTSLGAIIGLAVIAGLAYYFGREDDWMEAAGVAGVVIGLSMVADWVLGLDMIGVAFNPWTDFLASLGFGPWLVLIVGLALFVGGTLALGWDWVGRMRR